MFVSWNILLFLLIFLSSETVLSYYKLFIVLNRKDKSYSFPSEYENIPEFGTNTSHFIFINFCYVNSQFFLYILLCCLESIIRVVSSRKSVNGYSVSIIPSLSSLPQCRNRKFCQSHLSLNPWFTNVVVLHCDGSGVAVFFSQSKDL